METVLLPKAMLYVAEAACVMGCSSEKVYGLIHRGKLPAHKEGKAWKICVDDLEAYINKIKNR